MNIESIIATWVLIGSVSINSEVSFIGEEPDPNGVKDWLNGTGNDLIDRIISTTGLTLKIEADRSFTETKDGNPNVYWFSDEGVLESEVVPFDVC